jgi:integrase
MASTITPSDLETALERECLSPSVRNNFLSFLRVVFNWGIKRGYLDKNPANQVESSVVKRQEVQIYTPDEVQRLLDDALANDLELLPYRVLTIFTGIRPGGEATRVRWEDLKLQGDKVVKLSATITKKGRARFPAISDNAIRWLEAYRQRGGETEGLVVKYTSKQLQLRHRANLERAKVPGIKNGSRHSYCSYHLAEHGDIGGLTLQSGHADSQTLWRHYYQAATREDAARFWSIVPNSEATNIVAFG